MKLKVFLLLQLIMLFVACESDVDNTLKKSGSFGSQNGHEYVDLGLSVKWATCNVGATKPEEYGNYFAWGEIVPKNEYSWSTYFDTNDGGSTFLKYALNKKTTLDFSDDAAHVNWGGSWRMPTRAEQDELSTKCTWTWTTKNGVKGYNVVSPNGNSIFLPAAGNRFGSDLRYAGSGGYYWSSSLHMSRSYSAYGMNFDSSSQNRLLTCSRCGGLSVRPVCQ